MQENKAYIGTATGVAEFVDGLAVATPFGEGDLAVLVVVEFEEPVGKAGGHFAADAEDDGFLVEFFFFDDDGGDAARAVIVAAATAE